ncbi:MAG: hypothetical protein ACERKD_11045 [Prolixibacteraceae bacterium]
MKTKELFFLTLKIIGIIALWKAIQTFPAVIGGIGLFSSFFWHTSQLFLLTVAISILFTFVLPLITGLILLFKTEKVVSVLQLYGNSQIDVPIKKMDFYRLIIISFGVLIILHGAVNFLVYDYKTDTKTEYNTTNTTTNQQIPQTSKNEKLIITKTTNKKFNYFALIELIFGIVLLSKTTVFSVKLYPYLNSDAEKKLD